MTFDELLFCLAAIDCDCQALGFSLVGNLGRKQARRVRQCLVLNDRQQELAQEKLQSLNSAQTIPSIWDYMLGSLTGCAPKPGGAEAENGQEMERRGLTEPEKEV